MKCPERRRAARNFDFGSQIALIAIQQQSTVLDAMPMGRANAVRFSIVVFVLPAGASLNVSFLASNDEENFTQVNSTVINQAGIYSFLQPQVAFAYARIGFQASGFTNASVVFGVTAQIANI